MYLLIEFPDIQKYQKMKGFKYNSEFSTETGGAAFVKLKWLEKRLDTHEFNELVSQHLGDSPSII